MAFNYSGIAQSFPEFKTKNDVIYRKKMSAIILSPLLICVDWVNQLST